MINKTPIALMITDTHLHDENIDLTKDIFNQAIQICNERDIKRIFHLGDWFTSRKSQSEDVLLTTDEIIKEFAYNDIVCFIIKGNHDATQADSERSFINIFENNNFVVFKNENSFPFPDHNLNVDFIPYFKESGSYVERVNNLSSQYTSMTNVCLTHVAFEGVKNNDGTTVENGLLSDLFVKYTKIYVGHYHDESFIGDKVEYIGASSQKNHGEDNKKGFSILYSDGSREFIKSKFPEYITVKLDIKDEQAIKAAQKQYKNSPDHIRFVFTGDEAELKSVNKEKYAELGIEATFKKDSAVPLEISDLVEKASSVSFDRSNIISAFDLFCQTKHIEDNSKGKKYLDKI